MGLSFYKTAVSVVTEVSSSFSVKFVVHQGFALSPFLLIMVIDVLTDDVTILLCVRNH